MTEAPPSPIELPERFHLIGKLGEGNMGAVYRAFDNVMRNEIALKVILPERLAKVEFRQRFECEVRLLHRIGGHSNVVTLHERIELGTGGEALVMELVDGETLEDVLLRTRNARAGSEAGRMTACVTNDVVIEHLDWRQALEVTLEILQGLRHIHARDIINRDIKPANILIAREKAGMGRGHLIVKIADFGIAKLIGDSEAAASNPSLTMEGESMPGTPFYIAPEQVDPRRFGPIGPWTDLYALGVTLFEMLTLTPPFEGESRTTIYMAHCVSEPPLDEIYGISAPRTAKEGLRRILAKAMEKEAIERYQTADEFQHDIRQVFDGRMPIVATPYGGVSRARIPIWAWMGGAAALSMTGIAGLMLIQELRKHSGSPIEQTNAKPLAAPSATDTPSVTPHAMQHPVPILEDQNLSVPSPSLSPTKTPIPSSMSNSQLPTGSLAPAESSSPSTSPTALPSLTPTATPRRTATSTPSPTRTDGAMSSEDVQKAKDVFGMAGVGIKSSSP